MGWRTWKCRLLLLTVLVIVVSCGWAEDTGPSGTKQPECNLNVSNIRVGDIREVSCHCPGYVGKNLTIEEQGKKFLVDSLNGTALYRSPSVTRQASEQRYMCLADGIAVTSEVVNVYPWLNVTDLVCRYQGSMFKCRFTALELRAFAEDTHYQMSRYSDKPVDCHKTKLDASRAEQVLCDVPTAPNLPPDGDFTVIMSDSFGRQTQVIHRSEWQVKVLDFPVAVPIADHTMKPNHTCYVWNEPNIQGDRMVEWNVVLRHENASLSKNFTHLQCRTVSLVNHVCFENPPEGDQTFYVSFRRRINNSEAIWSDFWSPEINLTTPVMLPVRPPQFRPPGFSYDPKKEELKVYWEQLSNVEFNGPKRKCLVRSSNGKVNIITNSSALLKKWDDEKPGTVNVWSQNVLGKSQDSSLLEVPKLSNLTDRRITRYSYNKTSYILTWNEPTETRNLHGYIVYWCQFSGVVQDDCDDDSISTNFTLEPRYNFSGKVPAPWFRRGVSANYNDSISGGIVWLPGEHEAPAEQSAALRFVEGIIALLVLGVIFLVVRKMRKMSDIRVEMPDMSCDIESYETKEPTRPRYPAIIPGEKFYEGKLESVIFECPHEEPYIELQPMPRAPSAPQAPQVDQYVTMNTVTAPGCDGYIKPPPMR
ncbi:cytokine receptor isoform X1 [Drosophila subpulchrella]|uniref:cytokine receptor isoform X1 n=1 Tax=Drosophila subpulchrella TaxID=1486046 RepID=UPI0018A169A8|nr:cytokine receptor isoform X1 [Drosophila subpulchrella]